MSRQRKIFLRNQQVRLNVPFFNPKFHFFFAQKCLMVIRMFNWRAIIHDMWSSKTVLRFALYDVLVLQTPYCKWKREEIWQKRRIFYTLFAENAKLSQRTIIQILQTVAFRLR